MTQLQRNTTKWGESANTTHHKYKRGNKFTEQVPSEECVSWIYCHPEIILSSRPRAFGAAMRRGRRTRFVFE